MKIALLGVPLAATAVQDHDRLTPEGGYSSRAGVAEGEWAAFTGRARDAAGRRRAVTVIVNRDNPLATDHGAQIIVEVEGDRVEG